MLTALDTLDTVVKRALELQPAPAPFTEEQKDELIKRALETEDGKVELGWDILDVNPLPQGSLPEYNKDIIPTNVLSNRGNK